MRKRRILFTLGSLLLVWLAWLIFWPLNEPRHQGRYLSEWLATCIAAPAQSSEHTAATLAIQTIGTNAIPHLLQWIGNAEPAKWRVALYSLHGLLPTRLQDNRIMMRLFSGPARRAHYATKGFAIFGTNAVSAIPELEAMLKDQTRTEAAYHAAHALWSLGEPGLAALQRTFADTNLSHRWLIAYPLAMAARDGSTNGVPLLLQGLNDQDTKVRQTVEGIVMHYVPALWMANETNPPSK
jgi:hypothetical protein